VALLPLAGTRIRPYKPLGQGPLTAAPCRSLFGPSYSGAQALLPLCPSGPFYQPVEAWHRTRVFRVLCFAARHHRLSISIGAEQLPSPLSGPQSPHTSRRIDAEPAHDRARVRTGPFGCLDGAGGGRSYKSPQATLESIRLVALTPPPFFFFLSFSLSISGPWAISALRLCYATWPTGAMLVPKNIKCHRT
jgi:hypothetical protein